MLRICCYERATEIQNLAPSLILFGYFVLTFFKVTETV